MFYEGDVAWEDVRFLSPAMNHIRATTPKRRRQKEKEKATNAISRMMP
jgi:hypothetical protein